MPEKSMEENIEVRLFTPDEWLAYKGVRLKALKSDPKVFGSSYALEADRAAAVWQENLVKPTLGIFGVFHYADVIGMTGIFIDGEDSSTAKLWGSWLEPKWRGKGLSEKLYQVRLEWAKKHPDVKRIVVSHRESNIASKMANRKHGFVFTHAADKVWRDGVSEPELFYQLLVKT